MKNKMDRAKIGKTLKRLRGEKTQKEVADAIGVTTMAISQYERGERVPNDEIKIALSRYFGKSIDSIFFKNV